MVKKSIILTLALTSLLGMQDVPLYAQSKAENSKKETIDYIEKGNQMMMVFMERIKIGDLEGARKIAKEMTEPAKNIKIAANTDSKCFYSMIEKEYYQLKNKKSSSQVEWIQEPIADGYYLLAVLDFQEKKYKDAFEHIQDCVYWNPVRSPYYSEKGFLYLFQGDEQNLVNAQVAYEKAIELADNNEDMAAGLRGVASVMNAKGKIAVAIAALVLAKDYDSEHPGADEQILYIKREYPEYDCNMDLKEARKISKENNIQSDYSHEHVEVLVKMVSELKMPEEKEKAIILLSHARMLEPKNTEVLNKLKAIQK